MSSSSNPVRQPVRRHSKGRLALFDLVEATAAALGGRRLYAWRWLAPSRLTLREERVELPPEIDLQGRPRVRIAQLSDLHAGSLFDATSLEPVIDRVLAAQPDVVVVTGDFIAHEIEAGVAALHWLALGHGYEVTSMDVRAAFATAHVTIDTTEAVASSDGDSNEATVEESADENTVEVDDEVTEAEGDDTVADEEDGDALPLLRDAVAAILDPEDPSNFVVVNAA